MSIIQPEVYSWIDPDPIDPYGVAIVDLGFTEGNMINGYGLLSRGLLWQFYDVWCDQQFYDNISTNWSDDDEVITTTWVTEGVNNGY